MVDMEEWTNINRIFNLIGQKSPLQRKKFVRNVSKRGEIFLERVDKIAGEYTRYLEKENIPLETAVDSYLKMCEEMMEAQLHFMKTGQYPTATSEEFVGSLYEDEDRMKSYMIGLAMSQFLWGSHYDIYCFFGKYLNDQAPKIRSYLEIGPGHGLYMKKAMDILKRCERFQAIDISPVSIKVTQSIINYFKPECKNVTYKTTDMMVLDVDETYNFVSMGELLEHVDRPTEILKKLHFLMGPGGESFVSTSINSPAKDHVFHFETLDQVREMFEKCGFSIAKELVAPVEDLSMEEIVRRKITINYCSILHKRSDYGQI